MLLSDLGAEVIRIDRKGAAPVSSQDIPLRGRRTLSLDLKRPGTTEVCLKMLERSDVLIEGFRPGVMERLGLGPDDVLPRNPRLVYGRMTGWGQDGPLALTAGHDVNYIGITGALHAIGPKERPVVPLNLLGDFGGGALYLAFGVLAALHHVHATGEGQVVDCAIADGTASLMGTVFARIAKREWRDEREANILDGGAHFYGVYECADGNFISVGSIEPQFYAILREKTGVSDPEFDAQMSKAAWPELRNKLRQVFLRRTRAEWCALFEGTDGCVSPVLSMHEAPEYPHNKVRQTFVDIDGLVQPAPAPRFSKTPGAIQGPPNPAGAHGEAILREFGISDDQIRDALGA
jgi:alpha-methylacyl-CoA racemase